MTRPRRPNRKPTIPRKVAKNQMSKQETDRLDEIFARIESHKRRKNYDPEASDRGH